MTVDARKREEFTIKIFVATLLLSRPSIQDHNQQQWPCTVDMSSVYPTTGAHSSHRRCAEVEREEINKEMKQDVMVLVRVVRQWEIAPALSYAPQPQVIYSIIIAVCTPTTCFNMNSRLTDAYVKAKKKKSCTPLPFRKFCFLQCHNMGKACYIVQIRSSITSKTSYEKSPCQHDFPCDNCNQHLVWVGGDKFRWRLAMIIYI